MALVWGDDGGKLNPAASRYHTDSCDLGTKNEAKENPGPQRKTACFEGLLSLIEFQTRFENCMRCLCFYSLSSYGWHSCGGKRRPGWSMFKSMIQGWHTLILQSPPPTQPRSDCTNFRSDFHCLSGNLPVANGDFLVRAIHGRVVLMSQGGRKKGREWLSHWTTERLTAWMTDWLKEGRK